MSMIPLPTFDLAHTFLVAFLALAIERVIGYPQWLHKRFGHPVEWYGSLLSRFDQRLNTPDQSPGWNRLKGVFTMLALIALVLLISVPFAGILQSLEYSALFEALFAVPLLAQKELKRFVRRVADALDSSTLEARQALSHIVGRDTSTLERSDISRAAIESLAENTSDGIVAPAFWLAVFGLPGIAVYKVINTADSMIGYKSEKYLTFGWAAARLDDLVNLIGARLTGLLFAGAASLTNPVATSRALATIWHDAKKHTSPNAGWPEAAVAGVLDIRLGGPRNYNGQLVDLPWMGDGRKELNADDIRKALRLYNQALVLFMIIIFFFWLFVY
ncbi:Adenosylcobinamide-phosphate synthase [hydrothermal vent metagenome]|uniref:Adenosylcobinamide-phosphate synthase n=1 Tax=hydrothermal vent metagenome TaxID=652676 RepID=A0A3B0RKG2_9ZZZZ